MQYASELKEKLVAICRNCKKPVRKCNGNCEDYQKQFKKICKEFKIKKGEKNAKQRKTK